MLSIYETIIFNKYFMLAFHFLTLSTHKATLLALILQSQNGSSSGQSILENTGASIILILAPKAFIPHKEKQTQNFPFIKYSAPKARGHSVRSIPLSPTLAPEFQLRDLAWRQRTRP